MASTPKHNTKLRDQLTGMGFSINVGETYQAPVHIRGNLSAILKMLDSYPKLAYERIGNIESVRDYLGSDGYRDSFAGGTLHQLKKEIAGDIDMALFLKTRKELEKSTTVKNLKTVMAGLNPKRKRVFSEHDGDWSLDRHWEMAPYQATRREPQQVRLITVAANFSISAAESAENITAYGATVWALSDLIEKSGVQTRVVLCLPNGGVAHDRSSPVDCQIVLKEAGQYLSPSLLATAFKANFYRRPCFTLWNACSELAGKEVHGSLGRCIHWDKRIEYSNGMLKLAPGVQNGIHGAYMAELEEEILKALGKKKK